MTTSTDVFPPADDSGVTTERAKNTGPRSSRLNQALAWVGIVGGGLFIVAAIFLAGFFLSSSLGGPWGDHVGSGRMACCDNMKPGDQMKPGAMMGPDGHMTPGGMMPPNSHMTPGAMMPGGTMGPVPQSPATTAPNGPRP
jgi:hypothetical protein